MWTRSSTPTALLADVRDLLTGPAKTSISTLLQDPYAGTVRLKAGFRHLQVPAMPDPDECAVYLPLYEQVSTAVTLELLRLRYCGICFDGWCGEPTSLERVEVSLALLHLAIRDDLQTARRHRCPALSAHLEALLLRTTALLTAARTFRQELEEPIPVVDPVLDQPLAA
jgi:hypothetical protein